METIITLNMHITFTSIYLLRIMNVEIVYRWMLWSQISFYLLKNPTYVLLQNQIALLANPVLFIENFYYLTNLSYYR